MNKTQLIREIWRGTTPTARRARRAIKILFLITLFIVLFWIVPIRDVIYALLNADPLYIFLGLILVFPVVFLGAVQLKLLIRRLGISLSVLQILGINLTIKFYMLFMPNAFVGSGLRWYKFSKPDGKTAEALAAVAFNRILDTFLVVVIGLGFWILSGDQVIQKGGIGLVIIIIGTVGFWYVLTRVSLPIYKWFTSRFMNHEEESFWYRLVKKTGQLMVAVSTYAEFSVWELLLVITIGTARNLINVVSFLLLSKSVGIELSYIDMGWIQSVVTLTALLPFSIGEGLGYREVSLVAILGTFGISADLALAFSFIIFIRSVMLGLVGGVIEAVQTLQVKGQA
ncbi:MAG: lysylphosphatidylglycerol synthase transmembrane domain-containing protein [Chloroflexota bacterium]|nr:lysylphosphatidylglycerol synthase transmembrane domain-containing protein [Chloroflexota bacterium]